MIAAKHSGAKAHEKKLSTLPTLRYPADAVKAAAMQLRLYILTASAAEKFNFNSAFRQAGSASLFLVRNC